MEKEYRILVVVQGQVGIVAAKAGESLKLEIWELASLFISNS